MNTSINYSVYLIEVPDKGGVGTTSWVVGLALVVNVGSDVNVDTKLYVVLESAHTPSTHSPCTS